MRKPPLIINAEGAGGENRAAHGKRPCMVMKRGINLCLLLMN